MKFEAVMLTGMHIVIRIVGDIVYAFMDNVAEKLLSS